MGLVSVVKVSASVSLGPFAAELLNAFLVNALNDNAANYGAWHADVMVTLLLQAIREDEMSKLDASILSYDGKNFTRTETTLMEGGKSAVGTKLDPNGPAYKALMEKHSYTGPMTNQANYAPLIGADGKVSGALFVGIAK